jgi:hypothetical protein
MKNKLLTLAGALLLLAIVGKFYAKPVLAQVRATLIQDTDQPARAPFQVNAAINGFNSTAVAIPAGKRLVVDYVAISGAATTSGQFIEPTIILQSSVGGEPSVPFYLPLTPSTVDATQFHHSGPVTVYADTLTVIPAYAGYTPTFLGFTVSISGHLITP